jgi:hypothetical protein
VRDPRAALVSWAYRLATASGWDELFWYYPAICPPREFVAKDFLWQLQWCFEHHFDVFARWISDWCAVVDSGEVFFTTYEDFVRDQSRTLSSMLQFSALAEDFPEPRIAPSAQLLFREGTIDGWRSIASSLIGPATAAVPDHLWLASAGNPDKHFSIYPKNRSCILASLVKES